MPFRFSLDSLLRLRRSEQRQQEFVLQRANEQVNRMVREVDDLKSQSETLVQDWKSAAQTTGAELEFAAERLEVVVQRRTQAEEMLRIFRERQSLAAAELCRLWQRRESLDTLARREREAYHLEETRRDQRAQDDAFLQRARINDRSCPSK